MKLFKERYAADRKIESVEVLVLVLAGCGLI